MKIAHQLAIWFFRTVRHSPGFKPPPLVPPPRLVGETEELRKEIEELVAEAEAREAERDEAQAALDAELRKRLGAEEAAKKVQEERDFYEAYAAEQEAIKTKNDAALKAAQARIAALEKKPEAAVDERQKAVEQAPAVVIDQTLERSHKAASIIHLDEAATRELIDQQLSAAGWDAHSTELKYSKGARPQKGKNLAIAEWPTENGPADYVLFIDLMAVGVVEAKRKKRDVASFVVSKGRAPKTRSEEVTSAMTSAVMQLEIELAAPHLCCEFSDHGRQVKVIGYAVHSVLGSVMRRG